MPQISVKVTNGDLVRKGLESLRSDIPKIAKSRMFKHMENIVRKMKIYPPKPAGSRYVRTFTLRNSWQIRQKDNGYTISADPVQRGRRYGKYVVGDAYGEQQASQNSHWQLFRNVVEEEVAKMPKSIQDDIGIAAKRRGFG